jgi:hypothetical protein
MDGSCAYARRTRARLAPDAIGAKRPIAIVRPAATIAGSPTTIRIRRMPSCCNAGRMRIDDMKSTTQ